MFRALRFLGLLLFHTLIAIFGAAIAEGPIWKIAPAQSIMGVLWKECIFDLICATMVGFGMYRVLRTPAAKWVWILPSAWFAFGFLARPNVFGGLLRQRFFIAPPDLNSFFVFIVPLFRTCFYSAGAYISSRLSSAPITSTPTGTIASHDGRHIPKTFKIS